MKTTMKMYGSLFGLLSPLERRLLLFSAAFLIVSAASAQTNTRGDIRHGASIAGLFTPSLLPEAPVPVESAEDQGGATAAVVQTGTNPSQVSARTKRTGYFDTLIDPQEIAPRLSVGDKIGMGLKQSVSPFAVIGWVGSATYSETFNRSPNYGQSPKNYLQRIGAAAARASSEDIFSTSVMAPMLREDPRYFVKGPGHPGLGRAFYAVSRVLITRKDDGGSSANYSLLIGNAIGAGLTQTYYPAGNRNFGETADTFAISLAGSAVKFLFEEFVYKEASIAQLKRKL